MIYTLYLSITVDSIIIVLILVHTHVGMEFERTMKSPKTSDMSTNGKIKVPQWSTYKTFWTLDKVTAFIISLYPCCCCCCCCCCSDSCFTFRFVSFRFLFFQAAFTLCVSFVCVYPVVYYMCWSQGIYDYDDYVVGDDATSFSALW